MSRYKVVVIEDDGTTQTFEDATFTVSESGFLQVSVNAKALFCWAVGFWAKVSIVALDG